MSLLRPLFTLYCPEKNFGVKNKSRAVVLEHKLKSSTTVVTTKKNFGAKNKSRAVVLEHKLKRTMKTPQDLTSEMAMEIQQQKGLNTISRAKKQEC